MAETITLSGADGFEFSAYHETGVHLRARAA
jgi:hypothetical protein